MKYFFQNIHTKNILHLRMCDTFNLLGYSTFDEFIKDIETCPVLVDCLEIEDKCVEIKPIKKSVRFSDKIIEKKYFEPRENNVCPKYNLPNSSEDIPRMSCNSGMYLDNKEDQLDLIENNTFNNSNKVNDKEQKRSTSIMSNKRIKKIKEMGKINNVKEIVTEYLVGNYDILNKISETDIIDCVMYMMDIYEHLEEDGTTYTLDYKSGVTISNRDGKRQRDLLKTKIEYVTNKYL